MPCIIPSLKRLDLGLICVSDNEYRTSSIEVKNRKFSWETLKYDLTQGDIVVNIQDEAINPNFKYKSENKTWMAWACGMPVATNSDELEKFLDPDERIKEANKNLKFVKEECDIKRSVEEFRNLIDQCQKKK